jgi:hypothetical protein
MSSSLCCDVFSLVFFSSFIEDVREGICDGSWDGTCESTGGDGPSFSLVRLDRLGATVGACESVVFMLVGRSVWPTVRCDMGFCQQCDKRNGKRIGSLI